MHETKELGYTLIYSCNDCDSYLKSTNGQAMDIDISKNYGSIGLSWQTQFLPHVSIGIIAFDYVFKGDSSGVRVNSINSYNHEERDACMRPR
ncbi:MAG TPA: hypothetical protein VE954_24310 [Oligoflexus sp.]|uniref:hypothetical protein n=1 Tax=Oligoflexus sp. TaxID=1971216 RepID=UPI002D4B126C|nr:hypothetical protein [Oligoflexus sp.]HYX36239.1 hypothetical protein [Oligoflexus sp.]